MKKALITRSKLFFIALFTLMLSISVTYAQQEELPKGKWIAHIGMGFMNVTLEADITSKVMTINAVMNNKKQEAKRAKMDIIDVKVNGDKGKLLLKEQGQEKYAVGLFKKLNEEELLMLPPEPRFINKKEAQEFYENVEKGMKEELQKMTKGLNPHMDVYDLGYVFCSPKRYKKLSAMPDLPDLDKKGLLKLMDQVMAVYKDPKNKMMLSNPMSLMRLMNQMFIKNGYNPYTSLGKMMKTQMKFSSDADVQKKALEMQKIQMENKTGKVKKN